ncbi:Xaa-Pro peptidase family protein [Dactylosporangium darangshiense]|uniref:Xaa-Pro peptidase family protein n=1 Tax=Dactylosporangium darangshiense TaxID=579108 RepID=A0ABP8DC72_9ACTN
MELYTSDRLAAARRAAAEAGLDALLIGPSADLRYLTGYDAHALERLTLLVLPADGDATLIVPRLERPAAEASPAESVGVRLVDHEDGTDPYGIVQDLLGDRAKTVGLGDRMWAEQVLALRDALPDAAQALAGAVLRGLRLRKTPAEVEALRRAGRAIDAVHERMGEWLRPGRTEAEVAADIAAGIREAGHATVEFTIVAAGPNGASPHHGVSDRVIVAGEPVVVDIGGAMPDGYCSDSTRVYCVGEPPAEFAAYYAVLHEAQRAAVAAVRPGVTAESVDAAARDLIAGAGFGPQFLHRTGHGIGLDGHEDPYIVAGNATALEPGMAFSIEPGIYLAGRHGARIEDIVVCTDDGVERLNTIDTELVIL